MKELGSGWSLFPRGSMLMYLMVGDGYLLREMTECLRGFWGSEGWVEILTSMSAGVTSSLAFYSLTQGQWHHWYGWYIDYVQCWYACSLNINDVTTSLCFNRTYETRLASEKTERLVFWMLWVDCISHEVWEVGASTSCTLSFSSCLSMQRITHCTNRTSLVFQRTMAENNML